MAEQTHESKPVTPGQDQTKQASPPAAGGKPKTGLWIVGAIGVAVVGGLLVFQLGGKPEAQPSSVGSEATTSGDLTLQTADRDELDCAAAKGLQGYECGALDDTQTRQLDEAKKLRPFMTTDRQLYLIPGLFLEPAISQRYNAEPPTKPRDQLKRFTAKCKLKTIGELEDVKLRWSKSGAWEAPKKFPVATISGCTIEG
jgi:hypothetical protein